MSGWLQGFIIVATIAIVIQMVVFVAILVEMRKWTRELTRIARDLQAKIGPILIRTLRILEDSEDRIASIMSDAAELTRLARSQAQKVDRVFTDAAERMRVQIVRADQILTGALEVVEEAGATFRNRLWQPFAQISAMIKGVKAGLDMLRGQRPRPDSETATQDEELFI